MTWSQPAQLLGDFAALVVDDLCVVADLCVVVVFAFVFLVLVFLLLAWVAAGFDVASFD